MSTYSSVEFDSVFAVPVKNLEYRDMCGQSIPDGSINLTLGDVSGCQGRERLAEVEHSKAELAEKIKRERLDATQQAEQRLLQEYEQKLQAARAAIAAAISGFEAERDEYYVNVESEVVQLALAIAAKILHREAQVDPMLVAALVRMAVEKLRDGSRVTVRVSPQRAAQWKEYFAAQTTAAHVEVAEDAELSDHDCLLETELGVANFGLDTQLKEVEQGFFDLLALRPVSR
jgi:flagellar assembly protein FliH